MLFQIFRQFTLVIITCLFSCLSLYGNEEQPKQTLGKMQAIIFVDEEGKIVKDPNEQGVKFVGIRLPGADGSQQGLISDLESRFLNKNLNVEHLEEIKYRVILYYKEKGSSLVRVMIPPQDVTDGVLHLIVTETHVGEVRTHGNIWSSASFTKETVGLEPGDQINTNDVNTALTFLNRNPYKSTDVIFSPGKEPNTTDVELLTIEQHPSHIYAGVDNRGNETIGSYRQFDGFNCGNFLGLDHIFSYQFTTSLPPRRMHAHAAYYEIPLPKRMSLVAFGGYSAIHTKPIDEVMDSSGINVQMSGRYHFPMFAWGKAVNDIAFGFDYKRTNNNVLFSEIPFIGKTATLSQFVISYEYRNIRPGGWGRFNFEFFVSPAKWFTNQSKEDYKELSKYAIPHYFYFTTSWEKDFYLPHCMRIFTRLKGQYANHNLLPSEQLGFGGLDTVRGYEEREINGENGFLGNIEFKAPVMSLLKRKILCKDNLDVSTDHAIDNLLLLAFLDYGFVTRHRDIKGQKNTQYIASIGPGLEYLIDPYIKLRCYWGIRLKSTKLSSALGGRVNFSFVCSF